MIHYDLRCGQGHEFDGWFPDSAAFARQQAARLVQCPSCGGTDVSRALMAPALGRKTNRRASPKAVPEAVPREAAPMAEPAGRAAPPPPAPPPALPDGLRAMLQKVRAAVEKSCEHVGADFAAEARAIHDGKAPSRGIYGEATPDQAEALAEDGIEVARIPWVPRADG